jgi:hypothetical protein
MKVTKIAQRLYQRMPGVSLPLGFDGEPCWREIMQSQQWRFDTQEWKFCYAVAQEIADEDRQLRIMAAAHEEQSRRIERLERTLEDTRKLVQNHAVSTSKTRTFNPTEVSA